MPEFVNVRIKFWIWLYRIDSPRNHACHSCRGYFVSDKLRVVSFVCNKNTALFTTFRDQMFCNLAVVNFTPSDFKIDRISMRIGGNVYFCCCTTSRSSNGSFFTKPSSTRMLMSPNVTSIGEYPLLINFAS
jgi:hypothetical protein